MTGNFAIKFEKETKYKLKVERIQSRTIFKNFGQELNPTSGCPLNF